MAIGNLTTEELASAAAAAADSNFLKKWIYRVYNYEDNNNNPPSSHSGIIYSDSPAWGTSYRVTGNADIPKGYGSFAARGNGFSLNWNNKDETERKYRIFISRVYFDRDPIETVLGTFSPEYRFRLVTDDGIRLYIDGSMIRLTNPVTTIETNTWRDGNAREFVGRRRLSKGWHTVVIEHYNHTDEAKAEFYIEPVIESDPPTETTGPAETTTVLSTSANPSPEGSSVTFTARVSSTSGTPTGTVTFMADDITIGSAVSLVNGTATVSTAALTQGPWEITARYSGNSLYSPSTGRLDPDQLISAVVPQRTLDGVLVLTPSKVQKTYTKGTFTSVTSETILAQNVSDVYIINVHLTGTGGISFNPDTFMLYPGDARQVITSFNTSNLEELVEGLNRITCHADVSYAGEIGNPTDEPIVTLPPAEPQQEELPAAEPPTVEPLPVELPQEEPIPTQPVQPTRPTEPTSGGSTEPSDSSVPF